MPCVACREVVVGTLYHGTRLPTVGLQPLPGPPPPLRVTRPGSTPTDTTIFRYARKLRRLGHGPMWERAWAIDPVCASVRRPSPMIRAGIQEDTVRRFGRVRKRDRQRFQACEGSHQRATATPTAPPPGLCR